MVAESPIRPLMLNEGLIPPDELRPEELLE